ncbi:DNA-directed RNA polymerase III subunit RPC3 [Bienertia sinuspersici]
MAMLTQHGIKLAVHIITTDFGNLVSKVCECLLRRGTLSKALISRFTDLPQDKVKKSLWVLIQHNCVQAFALEQEGVSGDTMVVTQYMALFNNIIHRLRFPKFMAIVSKDPCKEGLEILEGLLQHGRLTLTQILDRAQSNSNEGSRDTHRESFIKLLRSRFVERCPAAEPLIPLPTEAETSAKKGGGRSAGIARKEVTLEERALAVATPMDAERFSLTDYGVDSDEEENGSKRPVPKAGDKRKQDTLKWNSELDIMGGKKEPIWRVNSDEFINRLRIKACIEYAREEYDNVAAVILNSMLEGTKCTDSTVSMSLDSIFEEVIKSEEGITMNLERLRCSLEQLDFCSKIEDGYSVDLKDIIKKAQLKEVESIVKKRYGIEAFRMFRLLSNGRALDTDKVIMKCVVCIKGVAKEVSKPTYSSRHNKMERGINAVVKKKRDSFLGHDEMCDGRKFYKIQGHKVEARELVNSMKEKGGGAGEETMPSVFCPGMHCWKNDTGEPISDRTFVDKKTTPKILYMLWKDNFIEMEKVTTGGPRQTDFFLWRLKKDKLWHQVLDEMYHAALNLSLRYAHEVDQDREIVNVNKEIPEVKKRRDRLIKVRFLLDSSLMKLDDAVLLFHDFLSRNTPNS